MADELKLPPDFIWSNDGDGQAKHRVSGKRAGWPDWMSAPNQQEIDYLVRRVRIEYRRDRLYRAVGCDSDAFRRCQITMRQRGYTI